MAASSVAIEGDGIMALFGAPVVTTAMPLMPGPGWDSPC